MTFASRIGLSAFRFITFSEIVRLRGKSVSAIRAVLETKRAFPEARVLH